MLQAPYNQVPMIADGTNLVTIRLEKQRYALPVSRIIQIVPMVTITPLPHTLGSVLGVINVRGVATPVIDLSCHLGIGGIRLGMYTPIVLTQIMSRTVGLVVDEVLDVLRLTGDEIIQLANIFPEGTNDLPVLHGMARVDDTLVPILDLERLFHPDMLKSMTRSVDSYVREAIDQLNIDLEPVSEVAQPAQEAAVTDEKQHLQEGKTTRRGRQASRRSGNGGSKQGAQL